MISVHSSTFEMQLINQKRVFQIPWPLALEWNVRPHSKVRIKPVRSAVKVALSLRLQPINPLVSLESAGNDIFISFQSGFICECFEIPERWFPSVLLSLWRMKKTSRQPSVTGYTLRATSPWPV